MGYLAKGQKWVARHGRWWAFGMIPALLTLIGYAVALVFLGGWADDLADWATPFADDWSSPWQGLLRGALTGIIFGGGLLISVITFTAVTLLVGQPFYEALCEKVDETEGGAPTPPDLPLWQELLIAARDSLYVLVRVLCFAVLLFACGFIPLIGQTLVPVAGFLVSGFFLAVELSSVGLQRRGIPQPERLRLLRRRLPLALGFGVPLVLAFLVPFVTVLAMPGAVAGATLLARDLVPVEPAADEDGDGPADGPHGAHPYTEGQPGPYGQNPYAATPQAPYEQTPYEQNPYAADPAGPNPYDRNPYGAAPQGPNPYRS